MAVTAQFSDGSSGIVESSAKRRPLRFSTAAHRPSGSSVNTSSRRGGSTIQASSLELALELPGPPARVAGEHARAAHGGADGVGVVGVAGHEAEVGLDQHDGLRGVVPLGQHDHAGRRHRDRRP